MACAYILTHIHIHMHTERERHNTHTHTSFLILARKIFWEKIEDTHKTIIHNSIKNLGKRICSRTK